MSLCKRGEHEADKKSSPGDYSGVEVDCYSRVFNRKVQLLPHLYNPILSGGSVLWAALEHTRKYRASQLFDFIHTTISPDLFREYSKLFFISAS